MPDNAIFVSSDKVSMFPSIDNNRVTAAVRNSLNSRSKLSPSLEYITEGLETCLTQLNSISDSWINSNISPWHRMKY